MDRIGRYEILAELGRGNMGIVYRARDPRIGREVAIKTIKFADHADSSEAQALKERLFREAQSAGRLSHPSIVTIYDIDEDSGTAYITMELVEGQTLESRLRSSELMSLAGAADILAQTAEGLDYAHEREIVHRDIKPANLMLTSAGRVKVMDFGIARISSSHLTQTGTVMGTPSYMSPEQVRGDAIDGRSDQFSLAVIAYEVLTGKKPFMGENLTSVIFKIVSSEPPPPKDLNPNISPELDKVVLRALSKVPSDRFENCQAFAQAFVDSVSGMTRGETRRGANSAPVEADMTAPAMTASGKVDLSSSLEIVGDHGRVSGDETIVTGNLKQLTDEALAKTADEPDKSRPTDDLDPVVQTRKSQPKTVEPAQTRHDSIEETRVLPPLGGEKPKPASQSRTLSTYDTDKEDAGRPLLLYLVAAVVLVVAGALGFVAVTEPAAFRDPGGYIQGLLGNRPASDPAAPYDEFSTQSSGNPGQTPGDDVPVETGEPGGETTEPADSTPVDTSPPPKDSPPPPPRTPAAPIQVAFQGTPDAALVVVDNNQEWTCSLPCSLELPRGQHTAIISKAEYRTSRQTFDVGREPSTVKVVLPAIQATVLVSSTPLGANVFVDGTQVAGQTNVQLTLSPGYHLVRVHKAGAGEDAISVRIAEGELLPIRFRLSGTLTKGTIKVETAPRGATFTLNGAIRAGVAPASYDTPPGLYQASFSLPGHKTVVREIEVKAGQTTDLSISLQPQ